jgi:hypothetical protein
VLVVARYPFRAEDSGLSDLDDVESVVLVRRFDEVGEAVEHVRPTVALIDSGYPDDVSLSMIGDVLRLAPETGVVLLTDDPPSAAGVARAIRAGALGFVDIDAMPSDFAAAVRAAHLGEPWLPPKETKVILGSVADNLEITSKERRSRLVAVVVALLPLIGALAAIMSFLWRMYLGHIGVRPIDIAIDPTTRVIDAITAFLLVVGLFGPLLYVGNWLKLLSPSGPSNRGIAWIGRHRRAAAVVLSAAVLLITAILAAVADLVLVLLVAPVVLTSLLAELLNISDDLPRVLRMPDLKRGPTIAGSLAAILLFLTVLSIEVAIVGPDLRVDGAHGFIAPRVLGFSATPMYAVDVDGSREPREVLYLGGNADLYVLVNPCNDDVNYVSVGSTQLQVIDIVDCNANDPSDK